MVLTSPLVRFRTGSVPASSTKNVMFYPLLEHPKAIALVDGWWWLNTMIGIDDDSNGWWWLLVHKLVDIEKYEVFFPYMLVTGKLQQLVNMDEPTVGMMVTRPLQGFWQHEIGQCFCPIRRVRIGTKLTNVYTMYSWLTIRHKQLQIILNHGYKATFRMVISFFWAWLSHVIFRWPTVLPSVLPSSCSQRSPAPERTDSGRKRSCVRATMPRLIAVN